jgi:hypothetical protein
LTEAELSLSMGRGGAAVEQAGEAFELFRSRHESEDEPKAQPSDRESRRSLVGTLARLLAEVDEAVARGDPESVEVALEIIKEALDVARRMDDTSHASGIRLRFPGKLAK